ncbi:uncharacterized protein BO80DRAFT_89222 [Aspergillus ibericus CBS 121593]|uniref:Uncharacterized protein n=1 Tax=Aspergillus ibericus CBS 121593 TaxID=1448316 RepID=A0A395GZ60_9EURO|nr:hypothetical protein BO80DRAFT_89222 [Aspergillus ibericus CBS 121593]RAL00881.1 hypothetical protein BO80DRAFT_89222 [Aspergillus ibericus CBS 121593]
MISNRRKSQWNQRKRHGQSGNIPSLSTHHPQKVHKETRSKRGQKRKKKKKKGKNGSQRGKRKGQGRCRSGVGVIRVGVNSGKKRKEKK